MTKAIRKKRLFFRPGARIAWLGGGGGGRNKFWGAREVYLCECKKGMGEREIYSSVDQGSNERGEDKNKKQKKSLQFKNFCRSSVHKSGYCLTILETFHEFVSEDQIKKKGLQFKNFHKFCLSSQNSCDFSRILMWRQQKKVFVPNFLRNPVWVHKKLRKYGR